MNWLLFFPFFAGCLLIPHLYYSILEYSQQDHALPSLPYAWAGRVLLAVSLSFGSLRTISYEERWLSKKRFLWRCSRPWSPPQSASRLPRNFREVPLRTPFLSVCIRSNSPRGAISGASIYWLSWLIGRAAAGKRGGRILPKDLLAWIVAGLVVGLLISVGMQLITWRSRYVEAVVILGTSGAVIAYLFGDIVYAGASSFSPRGDFDREWLARAAGWLSAVAVLWSLISVIALCAPPVFSFRLARYLGLGAGGVSGFITLFLGSSALTAATKAAEAMKNLSLARIASVAAVVFALILMAILSLLGQNAAQWLGEPFR